MSDPEWTPFWVNYKMLKKVIKELPNLSKTEPSANERDGDSDEKLPLKSKDKGSGGGGDDSCESEDENASGHHTRVPNRSQMNRNPGEVRSKL